MKSNLSGTEEKIRKATELLWKFFWFSFYLVIMPFLVSIIAFYILQLFTKEIYIVIGFTVIILTFSEFFFYKSFDKYRKKPFFKKKDNNPIARINTLFFITIISLIITPLFVFVSTREFSFDLLPLIAFILLYNIVWYYYYYQPIDTFIPKDGVFKHQRNFATTLKKWHNVIIIANYIIHIIFLSILFYTGISWLFALITNTLFYLIAIFYTRNQRKQIKEAIRENRNFLVELIKFQKKFVIIVNSVIFSILIQIAIIPIFIPLPGIQYTNGILFFFICLFILFILFYFKTISYVQIHYESIINHILTLKKQTQSQENLSVKTYSYQKFNSILTSFLIVIIILFAILIEILTLILIILPFIYILSYYERKAEYNSEKYNNWIYLINTIAILATISFGILPLISNIFFINIQLIIFLLSIYFILEIFAKFKIFIKESVRLTQNLLAVASFFLIVYLFFPLSSAGYTTFTTDQTLITISYVLIHSIFILIVLLISFYRFYPSFRKRESLKSFKICVFFNVLLIELVLIILINIRAFFLLEFQVFINFLVLSMILIPTILLVFLSINYLIKVYSKRSFLIYSYYVFWILIATIFISILAIFYTFYIIILLDLLVLSLLINYQLRFGQKIERFKQTTFEKLTKINSYFFVCVLFSIFFTIFFSLIFYNFLLVLTNVILSVFLSLVISCLVINIYAKMDKYFSDKLALKMNIITLLYSAMITFYLLLELTIGTLYVIVIPLLFSSIVLNIPIFYILKKRIYSKIIMQRILFINNIIIALMLLLIPSIIYADLFRLGLFSKISYFEFIFVIISIVNLTLGILFSILIVTLNISKKLSEKANYKALILRGLVLTGIILSFTIVFFYPFYYLFGTFYSVLVPIILISFTLYFLIFYAYKKEIFKSNMIRRFIILDILVLAFSIMTLPTIIGLELLRLGLYIDVILIILSTVILFFAFLKFLDYNSKRTQIKKEYIIKIKLLEIFAWFVITTLVLIDFIYYILILPFNTLTILLISVGCLIFFVLNIYTLKLVNTFKENVSEDKDLMLKHLKIFTIFEYLRNIIFFGIIISLGVLLTYTLQIHYFLILIPSEFLVFGIIWYLTFLFGFILIFLIIIEYSIKFRFSRYSGHFELFLWLFLKLSICFTIAIFLFTFSVINKICLFFLVFSLLTPISFYFSKKAQIKIDKYELGMKKVIIYTFLISVTIFYIEIFLFFAFTEEIPLFYNNLFFLISVLIGNVFLLSNFAIINLRKKLEDYSLFSIYHYYGLIGVLFFSLLFFNPRISLILLGLSYLIVLYYRNSNLVFRFLLYFFLTYISFILVLVSLDTYAILSAIKDIPLGFYIIVYLTSILAVLSLSALLNFGKNNYIEKIVLFSSMALWSFVFILTYTNILILYNITIPLFIFLLFMGINLYYLKDEHYKWFIKPCILLFVFNLTSWVSYSFLFINSHYQLINPALTFTLTASATGGSFILLYNKSSETFRKRSFSFVLPSVIIFFPLFIYFYLISYFPLLINPIIAGIIAINIGIFLFYFSIAIYQWKLSWAIWKSGWYAWNLLPIVNFIIIYNIVAGVNLYSNAINILGDFDILLITITICALIELPALYEAVEHHFMRLLFIVWGISLFLIYYISLNLFIGNLPLINTFFILFSTISVMPLVYKLKYWKILSIMWLFLGIINMVFFWFFLQSVGVLGFGILVSMSILIFGLFFHIYSFFPNIRKHRFLLLCCSYFIVLLGIFITIFTFLNSIILNPFISVNISFIIIASSLFTSKYTKLNRTIINNVASWILIVNLSLLTIFTFSLIPGLELFAIFLGITVFGGSFFVFNRYKVIRTINRGIPWMIMGFGLAASISILFFILLPTNLFLICAIYSSVFLLFLYFVLDRNKYLIFYLIPIPLAFFSLSLIPISFIIQNLTIITLVGLLFYSVYFQIIINSTNYYIKDKESREQLNLLKMFKDIDKIKLINLFCFIFSSTCLSLLIASITPFLLYNQIFLGLLLWSILMLISLKYFKYSKLDLKYTRIATFLTILSLILYLLISSTIVIIISQVLFEIEILLYILIIIIIFSSIIFFEAFVIDKRFLKLLSNSMLKIVILISWVFLSNLSCYLFFLIHLNFYLFILTLVISNLITNYFLKQIDIKRTEEYSKIRILLIYLATAILSFYIASAISDIVISLNSELIGSPSTLLFFLISFLVLFVLSYFFNKNMKEGMKNWIEFILYLSIQVLFGAFYAIIVFVMLMSINIFTIFLIILIETCLSYTSVKYLGKIFVKERISGFLSVTYSLLTLFIYLEISFLFFGLFIDILGIFGSLLISQIILFIFTISDIYIIKKLNETLAYFIHTISYIFISVLIFLILLQIFNLEIIVFCLFLLISMQFYTNYAFFTFLKKLKPNNAESYKNFEDRIKSIIGMIFYIFLVVFIQSTIALMPWEFQLLLLSSIVHVLMIADRLFLKFLGKHSDIIKFLSWVLIMISSSIYLYWMFNFYFYDILITVIPLIIVILVLEFVYFIKLLDFVQIIRNNKEKIKKLLIFILYINFMTWPLYFVSFNIFIILNLFLLSLVIFWILTYIDRYFKIFRERLRLHLRHISFLMIGLLFSIEIFIISIPYFVFLLNFSIASLIFLIFAVFVIKPFKEHSVLAFAYWNICFLFLSIIFYYIFLSLQVSLFFFLITFIIYWFIFGLERLRELFSKLIGLFIEVFRKIKQAILIIFSRIYNFIKMHYKVIWMIVSLFLALLFAYLVSPFLYIVHLIFSTMAVFGLLYSVLPSKKSDDPDRMFSRKMKRLIILWGSVIGIIFIFIPFIYIMLMIFIALLILGAILLPFIYYKEKKENISIKWRFYATIFFIIILIITGILMSLQFAGILIIG